LRYRVGWPDQVFVAQKNSDICRKVRDQRVIRTAIIPGKANAGGQ
jgi:precorrin-4 methylase